jgi:hypothetical protein
MRTNIPGLSSREPLLGLGLAKTPRTEMVPVEGLTALLMKLK